MRVRVSWAAGESEKLGVKTDNNSAKPAHKKFFFMSPLQTPLQCPQCCRQTWIRSRTARKRPPIDRHARDPRSRFRQHLRRIGRLNKLHVSVRGSGCKESC